MNAQELEALTQDAPTTLATFLPIENFQRAISFVQLPILVCFFATVDHSSSFGDLVFLL